MGFFKIDRQIFDHWLWEDKPFSKGQAWIDLIGLASYEDSKVPYKGQMVICERGVVNRSISYLSRRWGWGREKTRKFLSTLESDGMVLINPTTNRTTITLVNYGKYQDMPTTNHATNRQRTKQRTDSEPSKEKRNKEGEEKKNILYGLRLKNGEMFYFQEPTIETLKAMHQGLDVEKELEKMAEWCEANPEKRRSEQDVIQFAVDWLNRNDKRKASRKEPEPKGVTFLDIWKEEFGSVQ